MSGNNTKRPLALITGVGPGTGAAIARRFSAGGYDVAMLARNGERLVALEREIANAKGYAGALNKINHRNNQWREAERGLEPVGRRVKAPTLPLRRACARPRARGCRKSKTVAGRQGRALADRSADPVCEKCPHTLGRSDRRDSREHQGVGLDDAGAGGRGRRSDCGPRQNTRIRAMRHPTPGLRRRLLPLAMSPQLRARRRLARPSRTTNGPTAPA